jgi:Domain of unknown function (DUF4440)
MNKEHVAQEVMGLADAWATAELRGDTAFLENLMADDFIGIGPLGFLLTKQEWLARHQSGDMKYESFSLDEVKVRVYNDAAAILIGRQAQNAAYRGNSIPGQFRITLVFVQQRQWRLANLQLSTIGQPPNFTRA